MLKRRNSIPKKKGFDHVHFDVKCIAMPVYKLLNSSMTQGVTDGMDVRFKVPFWDLCFNF